MLKNLGTDYVDIGMIHYVDSAALWKQISEGDIMRYARQLKAEGKIRHIGLSSHNPAVALEAVKSGLIEVLMFSVNPCYDLLPGDEDVEKLFADESYEKPLFNLDPVREKLYETCQRTGVGITVMKVFGGGDLLTENSPAGKAMTVPQCIHYALTRPAVSSVMVGAHSERQLKDSLYYEQASEEERDYASVFASFPKISWKGHCMYWRALRSLSQRDRRRRRNEILQSCESAGKHARNGARTLCVADCKSGRLRKMRRLRKALSVRRPRDRKHEKRKKCIRILKIFSRRPIWFAVLFFV